MFELHHCDNTPEQRKALIEVIQREVEVVTANEEGGAAGNRAALTASTNNDQQQPVRVCTCCGECNKEATGKYTRAPLSALRYKRVTVRRR